MRDLKLIIVFIFLSFTVLCQMEPTPGYPLANQIRIDSNLYCDRTEVSNIDWREYMYWTSKTFGLNSSEYIGVMPDTSCWLVVDSGLDQIGSKYLFASKFDLHPVVGLTQKQVRKYSEWRSDRVFENYLINKFDYKYDANQTKLNYFSIAKYLKNELLNYPFKDEVKFYPHYMLPSEEERLRMLEYVNLGRKRCRCHRSGINKKRIKKYGFLLRNVQSSKCHSRLKELHGNVSEWSNIENVSYGCNWRCSDDESVEQDRRLESGANAWTGFRNIAKWNKISN